MSTLCEILLERLGDRENLKESEILMDHRRSHADRLQIACRVLMAAIEVCGQLAAAWHTAPEYLVALWCCGLHWATHPDGDELTGDPHQASQP